MSLPLSTLLYLLLPNLLFIAGWERPEYASVAIVLAGVGVYRWVKDLPNDPEVGRFPAYSTWMLVALAAYLTAAAGIGEWAFQRGDYEKHNLLFHDLTLRTFPVRYTAADMHGSAGAVLCYYVAYYLPAAVMGKVLGLKAVAFCSFLWAWLGMSLVLLWLRRWAANGGVGVVGIVAVVLLFGGLDVLTRGFMQSADGLPLMGALTKSEDSFVMCNGIRLMYSGNFAQWAWTPQHALGAWLGVLLLHHFAQQRHWGSAVWVVACTLLWSPFTCLGLLPFLALGVRQSGTLRGWFTFQNVVCAAVIGLPVVFYFATHVPMEFKGWLLNEGFTLRDWLKLSYFLGTEVLVYVLAIRWLDPTGTLQGSDRTWFGVAAATLCAIPLYRMGFYNDFCMRVATPSLFVLSLVWGKVLLQVIRTGTFGQRTLGCTLFALCAITPLNEHLRGWFADQSTEAPQVKCIASPDIARNITEISPTGTFRLANQYLGED